MCGDHEKVVPGKGRVQLGRAAANAVSGIPTLPRPDTRPEPLPDARQLETQQGLDDIGGQPFNGEPVPVEVDVKPVPKTRRRRGPSGQPRTRPGRGRTKHPDPSTRLDGEDPIRLKGDLGRRAKEAAEPGSRRGKRVVVDLDADGEVTHVAEVDAPEIIDAEFVEVVDDEPAAEGEVPELGAQQPVAAIEGPALDAEDAVILSPLEVSLAKNAEQSSHSPEAWFLYVSDQMYGESEEVIAGWADLVRPLMGGFKAEEHSRRRRFSKRPDDKRAFELKVVQRIARALGNTREWVDADLGNGRLLSAVQDFCALLLADGDVAGLEGLVPEFIAKHGVAEAKPAEVVAEVSLKTGEVLDDPEEVDPIAFLSEMVGADFDTAGLKTVLSGLRMQEKGQRKNLKKVAFMRRFQLEVVQSVLTELGYTGAPFDSVTPDMLNALQRLVSNVVSDGDVLALDTGRHHQEAPIWIGRFDSPERQAALEKRMEEARRVTQRRAASVTTPASQQEAPEQSLHAKLAGLTQGARANSIRAVGRDAAHAWERRTAAEISKLLGRDYPAELEQGRRIRNWYGFMEELAKACVEELDVDEKAFMRDQAYPWFIRRALQD